MEEEVKKIMEEFNGLIDEETAKMLLMEKKGERNGKKIEELGEGRVWLYAVVENIASMQNPFLAVIGDETGHCILKIWEEGNEVEEGNVIKIINGWAKKGMRGMEVNVGRYGKVEKVERKISPIFEFGKRNGLFNLRGKISRIYPTRVYLGKNEFFVRKIFIGGREINLINEMAKEMKRFKEGEEIVLLWLHERNGRIYGDELSRALKVEEFENMREGW